MSHVHVPVRGLDPYNLTRRGPSSRDPFCGSFSLLLFRRKYNIQIYVIDVCIYIYTKYTHRIASSIQWSFWLLLANRHGHEGKKPCVWQGNHTVIPNGDIPVSYTWGENRWSWSTYWHASCHARGKKEIHWKPLVAMIHVSSWCGTLRNVMWMKLYISMVCMCI